MTASAPRCTLADPGAIAIYVHIPWCVRKCPYCDFNSHQAPDALDESHYVAALLADLDADLAAFPFVAARRVASVFFGGGTPSLFRAGSIGAILDGCRARLQFAADCEISLESNPGTVEHDRFHGFAAAGINRVSLGVQSFDDQALQRLGRIHSADEARRAAAEVHAAGIAELNLDLMYALPEQTQAAAIADVEAAIALAPTHISHYQLTLEPNTLFAARPPPLPDEDAAWTMQTCCGERLASAGFAQYEVSAYARAGHPCRHNLNYWQFGDYLGIGAGAHGKLTDPERDRILRTAKPKLPRSYLERAAGRGQFGTLETVAPEQYAFEFMLNALRLNAGFRWQQLTATCGLDRADLAPILDRAVARELLLVDADGARASELGGRFLNDLIGMFLPEHRRQRTEDR
ncbi:MAG: radical SAM family heme chaperone HemW [Lysobacterales bacterium]